MRPTDRFDRPTDATDSTDPPIRSTDRCDRPTDRTDDDDRTHERRNRHECPSTLRETLALEGLGPAGGGRAETSEAGGRRSRVRPPESSGLGLGMRTTPVRCPAAGRTADVGV